MSDVTPDQGLAGPARVVSGDGSGMADFARGVAYEYGIGHPADRNLATRHYRAAEAAGIDVAGAIVGTMEDRLRYGDAYLSALASSKIRVRMTALLAEAEDAKKRYAVTEVGRCYIDIAAIMARAVELAQLAISAEESDDDEAAARRWKEIADTLEGGFGPRACARVGIALWDGDGLTEQPGKAIDYLRLGAAAGEWPAHHYLGRAYFVGKGVGRDVDRGLSHFQEALKLGGGPEVHFDIARVYWEGPETIRDHALAVRHARLAAKDKTALAVFPETMIALAYELGKGVPQNLGKSEKWYRKARKHGHDVREDLERLKQLRPRGPGRWLPLLSGLLFVIFAVGIWGAWPSLTPIRKWAILAVLADLAIWPLFSHLRQTGGRAQANLRAKFREALQAPRHNVRIGGARWTIVEGEFRHLSHDALSRGRLAKEGTSRIERHARELVVAKRRGDLGLLLLGAIACALAQIFDQAVIWSGIVASYLVLAGAWQVTQEYLYRHGWQGMEGAMVLDPAPAHSGEQDVKDQKAHGDARLTTEEEVRAVALSGGARRSSIHDQEF